MDVALMQIAWENAESYVFANPSHPKEDQVRFQHILRAAAERYPGHIWLSTSGSSAPKWVGLSKEALLASAAAVNAHLQSSHTDLWVNPLPHFHVGGLGILARSYLSGAACHDYKIDHPGKWCATDFYRYLEEKQCTLTSLVPAQLQDLVQRGWKAPPLLRGVIIGGGATLPELFERAAALEWPILPSYGMTECASQIATAPLGCWKEKQFPSLPLLSHVQACVREGQLYFKGPSLLTTYAYLRRDGVEFIDPKVDGWLKTEDRGMIEEGTLKIFGRCDAIVKIGGENVDLAQLENHLQTLIHEMKLSFEATLVAMEDERLGHCIHLAACCGSTEELLPLVNAFQSRVLPFERIRKTYLLPQLPRSALGKIQRQELMRMISSKVSFDPTFKSDN